MTLKFSHCTFAYRWRSAPVFKELEYELPSGLTLLLGPNGAGKSTLLKLGAGLTLPCTGTVDLDGTPSRSRAYRSAISWMPQQITAMTGFTAREQVSYTGWLKGLSKRDAWDAAGDALLRVELQDVADTRAAQLSGGQLRRLGVASALVHHAQVLLLDEPTAGMDPTQRRVFRDVLGTLTGSMQVLVSTHDVADLAEDCDSVTVLVGGSITFTGSVAGFLSHAPVGTVSGRTAEGAYASLTSIRQR